MSLMGLPGPTFITNNRVIKRNEISFMKRAGQLNHQTPFHSSTKETFHLFFLFRQSMKFAELIDGIKRYYNSS